MAHAAATTTATEHEVDGTVSLEEERFEEYFDDIGIDDHDLAELDDDDLDAAIRDGSVIEVADELADLHRALLVGRFDYAEERADPVALFRDHHEGGAAGARFTALLLCTEFRSRPDAGRLVRALADTGLLDDDDLDELATTFLEVDGVTITVPASWAGVSLSLDREVAAGLLAAGNATLDEDGEVDPLIPYRRHIRPPLRRWAAERLLRRGHTTAAEVRARARNLDREHRAAVVSGLLDASDTLTDSEVTEAVKAGLRSEQGRVRRRALEVMVGNGEVAEARCKALADPAAAVRTWGRRLPAAAG
jgi:hypothetical protein